MDKWMKVTWAVTVPALSFLVLNDTVQGLYGPSRELPLSYVVVEPDTPEPAQEEDSIINAQATEETQDIETVEDTPADIEETPVEMAEAPTPDEEEPVKALVGGLTADEMNSGEAAARACASCHQLTRERNAVGPHLVGLAGRPIGSIDGFRYSEALQMLNSQNLVWDAETLDAWLEDPDAFASGTKMMFNVRDAEERRLIVGWLLHRED